MKNLSFLFFLVALTACGQTGTVSSDVPAQNDSADITSDAYWKDSLTDQEYQILREHGTERAFTGEYWEYKGTGTFVCRACKQPLFDASTKYKSGTGWPSFYQHLGTNVETQQDNSHGMSRNEIHCSRCKGHLGHIFKDGPQPTGDRYCVNSASILLQTDE